MEPFHTYSYTHFHAKKLLEKSGFFVDKEITIFHVPPIFITLTKTLGERNKPIKMILEQILKIFRRVGSKGLFCKYMGLFIAFRALKK
jgi:hypothetical protein